MGPRNASGFEKLLMHVSTWTDADNVASLRVQAGQHSDKTRLQDRLYCRRLQVVEDLRPAPPTAVVVHQELERSVVIEFPGSEEPEQKGIVQAGPQGGVVFAHHVSERLHVSEPPFGFLLELLPGFGNEISRQRANVLRPIRQRLGVRRRAGGWTRPRAVAVP